MYIKYIVCRKVVAKLHVKGFPKNVLPYNWVILIYPGVPVNRVYYTIGYEFSVRYEKINNKYTVYTVYDTQA